MSCAEASENARHGTDDAAPVLGLTDDKHGSLPTAHLKPIHGWSLWLTLTCLCSGLFLSALETSIIATALVSISSSLGGFDKSNWVVTAYLITYTGFLVVWARVSDLFGRKSTFIVSFVIFTLFSLACGLSQTMEQLILFRSFQGMGGAGLYSLAMAVMTEVTPVEYVGIAVGLMSAIFGVSSILGTVLGGIIVSSTSWRWVFFLNLPPGITSLIVVIFIFPVNSEPLPITWRTIKGIDFFGVTLFLIGCVPLIFALESGGMHYEWNDAPIIVSFTLGGIGLISFAMWQWYISKRFQNNYLLPLVPASLVSQRTTGFSMLAAFFTGFPFMATIIFLPQRLQLQNGLTPIRAGIDMLPLLLLSATGAAVCGMVAARSKIGGMAKSAGPVPAQQYVFQVFLGLGFGIALSSLAIVARLEVSKDDISVVMGAITQVRVLGGLVGIAIGQAVISSRITSELGPVLGPDRLAAILQSITAIQMFPSDLANLVRESYGQSFSLQHKVMIGFAAAALLSCLAAWKHNFENMQELEKKRVEREMQSSCTGLSPMVEVPARLEGDIRDSGYELTDRGIHGRINQ